MALERREFLQLTGKAGALALLSLPLTGFFKTGDMTNKDRFDVIVIGGSYSGLAAAMSLGRALRKVLVIDSGKPCNRQTPQSHNFLTQDGVPPAKIAELARDQVTRYDSVSFFEGLVTGGVRTSDGFQVDTSTGNRFTARKLIFATGISDLLPHIPGFAECWGISVLHCPYCHGYEVRKQPTGILGNGDYAFEFAMLLSNWTSELTIYTNGPSALTEGQAELLRNHRIDINERVLKRLEHSAGQLRQVVFEDGRQQELRALYARPAFSQHCTVPEALGCTLTGEGYLRVDAAQETSVKGVYACGDNTSRLRTVANAVSMGTTAGMMASKQLILESF